MCMFYYTVSSSYLKGVSYCYPNDPKVLSMKKLIGIGGDENVV